MPQGKITTNRVHIADYRKRDIESVSDENEEKLLDKVLGSLLNTISTLPVGTKLIPICFSHNKPCHKLPPQAEKEMVLDPVMSSRWAHESIYNFLKECASVSRDQNGNVGMFIYISPGSGPGYITLVQDKIN